MITNAIKVVYFCDTLEGNSIPNFGILFNNKYILCLCCGSWIKPGDYEIIEEIDDFNSINETLKKWL